MKRDVMWINRYSFCTKNSYRIQCFFLISHIEYCSRRAIRFKANLVIVSRFPRNSEEGEGDLYTLVTQTVYTDRNCRCRIFRSDYMIYAYS